MSLERIVFERINDQFGWGQYGEFRVLIRMRDNYVNATKLCTDGGKQFPNWNRLDASKALIRELERTSSDLKRFSTPVVDEITAYGETRGTYVHPELVPHIASWISSEFAIKVSRIVNEHIVREYQWELDKRQGTINSLENKVDRLIGDLTDTHRELKETRSELGKAHRLLDVMNENMIETMGNLGMISRERVPLERMVPKEKEQLVLLHLENNQYKVIRAQRRAVRTAVSNHKGKYPYLRQVLVIDDHPNPVELWNAIKQKLKMSGIDVKVNDVLNNEKGEAYLMNLFQRCNMERFTVFEDQRRRVVDGLKGGESGKSTVEVNEAETKDERRDEETREERKEEESNEEGKQEEKTEETKTTEEDEEEGEEGTTTNKDIEYENRIQELLHFKIPELKEMCRALKLTGWSKLNKMKLVHCIATHEGK